jgi:hypothetical protein
MITPRRLALDSGFGGFKIAEVVNEQVVYHTIPAVVAMGHLTDMGLLSVGGMRRSHKSQVKPYQVSVAGQNFLVGANVQEHREPSSRLDYQRLANGPELQALMYTTLACQLNSGPYACSILIGLPVEVMQDRSKAQKTLYTLRSWLIGSHKFSVDGIPYSIQIDKIKAMAQPLGTYFAYGLTGSGRWNNDRIDWDAPTAVGDIGFNTVDLFGIKSGQLINRFTSGGRLGMHRASRRIIQEASDYRVKLSLYEADQMIRDFVAGKPVTLYHPNGSEEFSNVVKSALSNTFTEVYEFFDSHLGSSGFRYFILTGGGVVSLNNWLVEEYPTALIPADPVAANAIGLAKFAARSEVFG